MQVNEIIWQLCKLGIDDRLSSTDSLECAFTPVASVAALGLPLIAAQLLSYDALAEVYQANLFARTCQK
jgi:hypothetical protein